MRPQPPHVHYVPDGEAPFTVRWEHETRAPLLKFALATGKVIVIHLTEQMLLDLSSVVAQAFEQVQRGPAEDYWDQHAAPATLSDVDDGAYDEVDDDPTAEAVAEAWLFGDTGEG